MTEKEVYLEVLSHILNDMEKTDNPEHIKSYLEEILVETQDAKELLFGE